MAAIDEIPDVTSTFHPVRTGMAVMVAVSPPERSYTWCPLSCGLGLTALGTLVR